MAYASHFVAKNSPTVRGAGVSTGKTTGRVIKTVLSLSDNDCKDSSMLNGVFYRIPSNPADENIDSGLNTSAQFARQGNSSIRTLPIVGELVEITFELSANSLVETVPYWNKIVNVWNHPNHNISPDIRQNNWQTRIESSQNLEVIVHPLQANPGDTLLEGRLGQSIRFGGNRGQNPAFIDSSNDGKPVILISNGQTKVDNGNIPVYEDINGDDSSIYMVSDHIVPVKLANTQRNSYDISPLSPDTYVGNQIVLNTGNLVLNAKEESILLSAKQSIGISADSVNLDATKYFCVDSKKIYLGKAARTSAVKEPVILGTQLENWLNTLLDSLETVSIGLTQATSITGGPVTQLNIIGPELSAMVGMLRTQIPQFQSKKVYTE